MKKFFLELTVFVCGGVVMAYEITGSRILGPFVGTSMFVWSSIIGIILFSLSLGYYFGGRFADRTPSYRVLSIIIALSGLLILVSTVYKDLLLHFLIQQIENVYVISVLSSLLLFALPALLLGMVSPFAARLKIQSVKSAGATAGYLYAISTLGSITGTFLAGFYLIPSFRLTWILFILSFLLIGFATGLFLTFYNQNYEVISKPPISND